MYVTQNVEPNPSSMKEIIQCAGGQVSFAGAGNTFNTSIAETVRDKCLLSSLLGELRDCEEF